MDNSIRWLLDDLVERVVELQKVQNDLNRRVSNIVRPARVVKVDADKYTHRVAYAQDDTGQDVTTTDIKWSARAGKVKDWSPPTVGEQVLLISPSGEINENSFTIPGGFSEKFPPNHNKEGEQKVSVDTGQSGGDTSSVLRTAQAETTTSKTVTTNANQITDHAARIDHNKGGLA